MERLRKERSIARFIFTKANTKFAEQIVKKDDLNLTDVKTSFELLTEKANTLFSADDQVRIKWLEQEEPNEEDIIRYSEDCDVYKTEFLKTKLKYKDIVLATHSRSHDDSLSAVKCKKQLNKQLPKIELSKFNGDPKNWLGFWKSFKKIHDDKNLDDDDRMAYLIQSMVIDSAAYDLVKSFPPCGEKYNNAMEQLKTRCGKDELLIEIYVQELLSIVLQQANESDKLPLRSLYDKMRTQLKALESLGVTSDKYASMLYPLVESALPDEILRERHRGKGADTDNLSKLLDFMKTEVESEERTELARKSLKMIDAMEAEYVPTLHCLVAESSMEDKSSKGTTPNEATPNYMWCNNSMHGGGEMCVNIHNMTPEERIEFNMKRAIPRDIPRIQYEYDTIVKKVKDQKVTMTCGQKNTPKVDLFIATNHADNIVRGTIEKVELTWTLPGKVSEENNGIVTKEQKKNMDLYNHFTIHQPMYSHEQIDLIGQTIQIDPHYKTSN